MAVIDPTLGVLLGAVFGLYVSQGLLYYRIAKAAVAAKTNAEQAERNTRLIHDHIIEGTNPHPKKEGCELCRQIESDRGAGMPSDPGTRKY